MGNMEGHLENATTTHWWKSPRWIVIRIEALVVVAIIFSFFLAAFGSCRRWSNRWIVQKGFFVAQVLSLSLGTYSIGLMQSSSVKSEMYPIWTVSLFTLFGCIDPITTYNGLDYKGPLSKVVYVICLNCGYVLLMSVLTISNVVGNAAIITLSAITFIKSFHRSFALVEQKKLCDKVYIYSNGDGHIFSKEARRCITADIGIAIREADIEASTRKNKVDIEASTRKNKVKQLLSCYDTWIALCLSHKLRPYFLGLDYHVPNSVSFVLELDVKWALKIIEIELAFVYDALFSGNPFLHHYQVKTACLWALLSFTGICFVLVATAIPGGMRSRSRGARGGCTKVVDTTIVDYAITFVILLLLALLQLMQLAWPWTSNWARVALVCAYTGKDEEILLGPTSEKLQWGHLKLSGWKRLKALVATNTNLFDKYLWQDKMGQYSMLPEPRLLTGGQKKGEGISSSETKGDSKWGTLLTGWWKRKDEQGHTKGEWIRRRSGEWIWRTSAKGKKRGRACVDWVHMLGLHYIWQVILELFSSDTNKRGGIKLDEDVKDSIINFLGQIRSNTLDKSWLSSLPKEPQIRHYLPQFDSAPQLLGQEDHCYRYVSCVMTWHIATWYCELAEQKKLSEQKSKEDALMSNQAEAPICCGRETTTTASYYLRKAAAAIRRPGNCFQKPRRGGEGEGEGGTKTCDDRNVANVLSQYCVYLVKSAPELLPGPVSWTKRVYDRFARDAKEIITFDREDKSTMSDLIFFEETMSDHIVCKEWNAQKMDLVNMSDDLISNSMALAKLLMKGRSYDELWKMLVLVWVQLLVYAAPYGNVEAHRRHLSQGSEFITHLWALLYHLDIREWKVLEVNNLSNISNVEDAKRILNGNDRGLDFVFFYANPYFLETIRGNFVAASKVVDGVMFYLTSSLDVAQCVCFPPEDIAFKPNWSRLVFLNKADNTRTFYDSAVHGSFNSWDIAQFVYENKLASAKARAQETAPSTTHNPIHIEKQRSEEGETEGEITAEIQPDFGNYTFGPLPTLHTPPAYQAYYHSLGNPPTQMPAAPQNHVATIQEWEIPSTTPPLRPVRTRRATPYPTTRNTVPNAAPPQTQATSYGVSGVPECHEKVEVPSVLDAVEEDNLEVNDNMHDISTVEDAQRILNNDDHDLDIVVFFADSVCPDGFVAASKLVHGVKFYFTSSRDVAKCLYFPESVLKSSKSLLFLNNADMKITFYDSSVYGTQYTPWNVAQFVYENKLAWAKARAQETAPSSTHNAIAIQKQSSEEEKSEDEITVEIQ